MSAKTSRNRPRINPSRLLACLLVTGLSIPALLGQSVPFPTYKVGPQTNGTFVASDGTILTPAGTQVNLGIRPAPRPSRSTPPAITPPPSFIWARRHKRQAVTIFNTQTGAVLQTYEP